VKVSNGQHSFTTLQKEMTIYYQLFANFVASNGLFRERFQSLIEKSSFEMFKLKIEVERKVCLSFKAFEMMN
jgi:hypothetical protein